MPVAARPVGHALRAVIVMTTALAVAPTAVRAQVFGTWAPAVPYPTDSYHAGAFVLVGEPFGLVGQLRTGIDENWDIGIQLGFPDFDAAGGDALIGIAGDAKYLILPEAEDFPLDLAVDVAVGYQHADILDLVDFDFGAVGSKSTTTSGGTTLIPYGALMLAVGHWSLDVPGGDVDDTELDINVRFGLDYPFRSDVEFLGELNLSSREDTIALALGLMARL